MVAILLSCWLLCCSHLSPAVSCGLIELQYTICTNASAHARESVRHDVKGHVAIKPVEHNAFIWKT